MARSPYSCRRVSLSLSLFLSPAPLPSLPSSCWALLRFPRAALFRCLSLASQAPIIPGILSYRGRYQIPVRGAGSPALLAQSLPVTLVIAIRLVPSPSTSFFFFFLLSSPSFSLPFFPLRVGSSLSPFFFCFFFFSSSSSSSSCSSSYLLLLTCCACRSSFFSFLLSSRLLFSLLIHSFLTLYLFYIFLPFFLASILACFGCIIIRYRLYSKACPSSPSVHSL